MKQNSGSAKKLFIKKEQLKTLSDGQLDQVRGGKAVPMSGVRTVVSEI